MTFIRLQNTKEDIFKYYKQHKTKQKCQKTKTKKCKQNVAKQTKKKVAKQNHKKINTNIIQQNRNQNKNIKSSRPVQNHKLDSD